MSLVCVVYARNRNHFEWRDPCEPSGQVAKSSAHQIRRRRRRRRGLSGQGGHLSWRRFDLLCVTIVGYIDKDCRQSQKVSMLHLSAEYNVVGSLWWTEGFVVGCSCQEVKETCFHTP